MDLESSALLDHIFASEGRLAAENGAEWDSLSQGGAGGGCSVFSVVGRRFPEQEVGGKGGFEGVRVMVQSWLLAEA